MTIVPQSSRQFSAEAILNMHTKLLLVYQMRSPIMNMNNTLCSSMCTGSPEIPRPTVPWEEQWPPSVPGQE